MSSIDRSMKAGIMRLTAWGRMDPLQSLDIGHADRHGGFPLPAVDRLDAATKDLRKKGG